MTDPTNRDASATPLARLEALARELGDERQRSVLEEILAELRAGQDRRLALFVESCPAAVAMFDRDMRYLMASRRWVLDYGLEGREILGRSHYEVFPEIDERWKVIHRRCLSGESARMEEDPFPRADGSLDWVRWEIRPWHEDDGSVGGILLFTEVITRLKRDAEELAAKDRRLAQAQKMEALGRLAGGVAHDFNNLLTAILGFLELARTHAEAGSKLHVYLTEAETAGHHAADLTRELLALGRDRARDRLTIPLSPSVAELRSILERLVPESIELVLDLDPDLPAVRMDPSQLEQLVINLVANARDAMPEGGRLSLRTGHVGDRVVLEVEDEGRGMDDAIRDRMFDPFFTTKEPGHGTGLGLSTVYGIVRGSGGSITVDSSPGAGTRVRIELPAVVGEPSAGDRAPDAERVVGPPLEAHVLLVEDNDSVRRFLIAALEDAGARVTEARDGAEALARWKACREPVDVLVTDIVMPRMNGDALAVRLRAESPELAVVLCSGYHDGTPDAALLHDDRTRLLSKPVSSADLLDAVRLLVSPAEALVVLGDRESPGTA